jgi:hypothetical protein
MWTDTSKYSRSDKETDDMATNRKKNSKTAHARDRMKETIKQNSESRKEKALVLFEDALDKIDDLYEHLAVSMDLQIERDAAVTALEELLEAAGIAAP